MFSSSGLVGHISVRKEECIPGVNSGFNLKGVIGPLIEEMLLELHAVRNESRVGWMRGC